MRRIHLLLGVVCVLTGSGISSARELTIEDRVEAQRSIENVFWSHRIWPTENPSPKPPLAAVLPDAVLRARVADTLRESNALATRWNRPITATALQHELDRMVAETRDPQVLGEIFHALGDDPRLIVETLVRQSLADRLARIAYAEDDRIHGAVRRKAEAATAACDSAECMKAMGGSYRRTTWQRETDSSPAPGAGVVRLDDDGFRDLVERTETLTVGVPDALTATEEAFTVTAVLSRSDDEIVTATVSWPRRSFESWWTAEKAQFDTVLVEVGGTFEIGSFDALCTLDTWTKTRADLPDPRAGHVAVWTGSEMIVWGGSGGGLLGLGSGARYNPATDSWVLMGSSGSTPSPRLSTTAVWTGTEMIVWGGDGGGGALPLDTGGRYDPTTDAWTPTSIDIGVPAARYGHTAIWTGSEMIVWGGFNGASYLNTGGRYDPMTNGWSATSVESNVPAARRGHTAVWTGSAMIVWGGFGSSSFNTGGRYTPDTDAWLTTATTAGVPTARSSHAAVWSGTQMIVWGGKDGTGAVVNTGSRYNPSTNAWSATIATGAPVARQLHTAIWAGTVMVVWGGSGTGGTYLGTGGRYNPTTNAWTATSTGVNAPATRESHSAVWTGTRMIVWGGIGATAAPLGSGGRYDPSADTWLPTSIASSVLSARFQHEVVWTGAEMVVWGGYGTGYLNSGGRYVPATDSWTPTSTGANAPAGRTDHTVLWTGTRMFVWGGVGTVSFGSAGALYDPMTDSWQPTSTGLNVPVGRRWPTSIWTGTEVIVWGGEASNTGGRYNPSTDSWLPTSVGVNVPAPRFYHTAVWTGTEMIVWGGTNGVSEFGTGGRYDPGTDSWQPTGFGGSLPPGRSRHVAVWTGDQMVIWGGGAYFSGSAYNTGGRYDPTTDSWLSTMVGPFTPTPRYEHTGVWNGTELIVWGGGGAAETNTGGRYNPATNWWTPTSEGANVPDARTLHTAVWTGTQMIVWGGRPTTSTGGIYCGCPAAGTIYRDVDGDGYGSSALTASTCDGTIPAGYVATGGDCDDASASINPGAAEVCNGLDDDCNGPTDDGIAAPSGVADLAGLRSGTDIVLSWSGVPGASAYDVVKGGVDSLRSGGGNFTTATTACLGDDLPVASTEDTEVPSPDAALWYLVRAANCGGNGTYDERSASQSEGCDAEIEASGADCP